MYSISDDTDAKFVLAALFPLHDNDVYSFGFERVIERYPHTVFPIDRPVNDLYGIKIISGNINISVIRSYTTGISFIRSKLCRRAINPALRIKVLDVYIFRHPFLEIITRSGTDDLAVEYPDLINCTIFLFGKPIPLPIDLIERHSIPSR